MPAAREPPEPLRGFASSREIIPAAALIARKAETRELGEGPLPGPIAAFMEAEFAAARETFETAPVRASEAARERADAFFREVVQRGGGGAASGSANNL